MRGTNWKVLITNGPSKSDIMGAVFYGVSDWQDFSLAPCPGAESTLAHPFSLNMRFEQIGSTDNSRLNFDVTLEDREGRRYRGWYNVNQRKGTIAEIPSRT